MDPKQEPQDEQSSEVLNSIPPKEEKVDKKKSKKKTNGQNTNGDATNGQNTSGQNNDGQNTNGQNTNGSNGQNTNGQNTNGQNTNGTNGTNGQNTNGQNTNGQNTNGTNGTNGQNTNGGGQNTNGTNGTNREQIDQEKRYALLKQANELEEMLQRGEEGTAENKAREAEEKYLKVAEMFGKLSLEEKAARKSELTDARKAFEEATYNELQESDSEDNLDEIGSAKVLAKLSVGRRKLALVELGSVENAHCYRLVNQGSVDQLQLAKAPDYKKDLRPKIEITSYEAKSVIGVAFKGGAETLVKDFSVKNALAPRYPKVSKYDRDHQRPTRPPIYLIGRLMESDDNPNKNKWNLWMLSRATWEKRIPDRDVPQLENMSFGKAVRQFDRYRRSLLLGPSFIPEQTPEREFTPGQKVFRTKATSASPEPEDISDSEGGSKQGSEDGSEGEGEDDKMEEM